MNKIFNIVNVIIIILVLWFGRDIAEYLNDTRERLSTETLSDLMVIVRYLLNNWEGILMALNFTSLFFARIVFTTIFGAVKKVST